MSSAAHEDLGYVRPVSLDPYGVKQKSAKASLKPVDFTQLTKGLTDHKCDPRNDCTDCQRFTCRVCKKRSPSHGACPACAAAARESVTSRRWEEQCGLVVPARFASWRVDSDALGSLVGTRALRDACEAATTSRTNVVLVGLPGTGKTCLAAATLRHWGKRDGAPGFISAMDLARAAAEHPLGHGQAPAVTAAIKASVLVLDDLGQEGATYRSEVEYVIACRHNDDKPTIVTTFLDSSALANRYGGGVERRVYEHSTVIELRGRR